MRLIFYASDKPREQELARAVCAGARSSGLSATILPNDPANVRPSGLAAMVGVKSARLFAAVKSAGAIPIYFDKGYIRTRRAGARTWEFWRVSVGAHHPTATLMAHKLPDDRLRALRLDVAPWRRFGLHILFAGSSAKYHEFYGLPDPTTYAAGIIDQLRQMTDRPIVYRPKPSWRDAVPIPGSTFSPGKDGIVQLMLNAHCLITHGSNACFEAALAGIPTIVLGDAVARPISSTTLDDLDSPICGKRSQWLANLAYRQWTIPEMESGEMWQIVMGWIDDQRA